MTKYQNVDAALRKLTITYRNNPYTNLQLPSHVKDHNDVQKILEVLTATNDINLQIKLFLVLSACSMCEDANLAIIIKCKALYEKINNVLETGLPRKAVYALNFLSSLLQVEEENDTPTRRDLAQYAKVMVRASGCLGTMANKFNDMMYIDTWNAFCQCLAAACCNCEPNQSYCTHLIPVCVQKCSSSNKIVFNVLQNLLRNHSINMRRFVESNGLTIFTRELLQYDKCIQLLRTVVVQYSDAPQLLIRQTEVLNNLRDFVRLYGAGSQIGHKAMIILQHIESRASDALDNPEKNDPSNILQIETDKANNEEPQAELGDLDNTAMLMRNIVRAVYTFQQTESIENVNSNKADNPFLQNILKSATAKDEKENKPIEQNKYQKTITKQSRKEPLSNTINAQEPSHKHNQNHKQRGQKNKCRISRKPSSVNNQKNRHQQKEQGCSTAAAKELSFSHLEQQTNTRLSMELSFTFLQNNQQMCIKPQKQNELSFSNSNVNQPTVQQGKHELGRNISREPSYSCMGHHKQAQLERRPSNTAVARELSFSFLERKVYIPVDNMKTATKMEASKTQTYMTAEKDLPNVSKLKNVSKHSSLLIEPEEFNPIFSSTLKDKHSSRRDTHISHRSKMSTQSKITRTRRCVEKRSPSKRPQNDGETTLRNTSMSSRFFNAVNVSCTSIVKTVTNIFKKKKPDDSLRASVSPKRIDDASCSFSFLNYMRKRDAVLNSKLQRKRNKDSSEYSKGTSCDTCDDTRVLRKKMLQDEHLRQTVKKLKMGINLFGCDFKKISRTMWPQETYMKPAVLYNLYRKLLAK